MMIPAQGGRRFIVKISRYRHRGKEILNQVGEKDIDGEIVMAIFEADPGYVICTLNRGFGRGDPMIMGNDRVSFIEYFSSSDQSV